ncbi:MAG: enolase C-terminal domain-like protein [Thermodesulfobacteriota bacterium]|nr:enolase C-terminal domain-like protein [Thermodesulfobacteriota bacterium]
MHLTRVVLYENRTPFVFRFQSPHTKWTEARSIIISLGFDNGIFAWGESSPRPYVTGEDCASVLKVLKTCLGPKLIGTEITPHHTVADIKVMMEAFATDALSSEMPVNSALGAVDLALLDALGKLRQESIATVLGLPQRSDLLYSTTVQIISTETVKKHYAVARDYPFKHFKIALSGDPDADMERVSAIRSLAGDHISMGLEGNGKLTMPQLERILAAMPLTAFTFFEQPLAPTAIDELKEIRSNIPIPVVADESACSFEDVVAISESGLFDRINIKISKCGGFLQSLQIADYAKKHGLSCHLGAHVGESLILGAAGICFAMTAPGLQLMETGSSLLFGEPPMFLPSDGESACHVSARGPGRAPGLGIDLSEVSAGKRFGHPVAIIEH